LASKTFTSQRHLDWSRAFRDLAPERIALRSEDLPAPSPTAPKPPVTRRAARFDHTGMGAALGNLVRSAARASGVDLTAVRAAWNDDEF
jgi:hypothetical protein